MLRNIILLTISIFSFILLSPDILDLDNIRAQTVVDTVDVGSSPLYLESTPNGDVIYVLNFGSATVSVIDTATNTVTDTIDMGDFVVDFELSPDGDALYVTNGTATSKSISVIDTATNTVTDTIPMNGGANTLEFTPDGDALYVTQPGGTVSVVDPSTNTVIKSVFVGFAPEGIESTPDGDAIYVASFGEHHVSLIDTATNTVTATIDVGKFPRPLVSSPDGQDIYVANTVSNTVSVIDTATNTVTATIDVGLEPEDIISTPDGEAVYVANLDSGTVSVIDTATNTVTATVGVARGPIGLVSTPDGEAVYVANLDSGTVSVIDTATNTVTATVGVGRGPIGLVSTPDGEAVYVANFYSNDVSVISIGTPSVQPPTATIITSSTDGNGNDVLNKSSTVSTSMTFQVTATKGTNNIAGFECSLDNNAFSNCATSNPATIKYDNLASDKKHTVEVRAVDTQGNTDPKPAVFVWTVLTPQQAIDKLKDTIVEMHLSKGTTTSLQAPLNPALKQLDKNNNKGACGPLGAFLDQVNEKRSNGQLTSSQASELRQQATSVQKQIGCSSTTASTASTGNSQSNSPIENIVNSALSNIGPIQSEQTDKALDNIKKGLDLYGNFYGGK